MLKAVGALEFTTESGNFWAVYNNEFQIAGDGPGIEGSGPALECRTVDVQTLSIKKRTVITYGSFQVRVYRVMNDGGGESILLLEKQAVTGQSWQPEGWQPEGWQPGAGE